MDILLSIAIPTYNRVNELRYGLLRFVSQMTDESRHLVEIHVADDCSTDETPGMMADMVRDYPFIHYERYPSNIGLEKNLIQCTRRCRGKYLWIFGDDDFLECPDALPEVLLHLKRGDYPFYILNRTRRSFDLSKLLTSNWMNLSESNDVSRQSLRAFCSEWGIISIIGFISVNIFLREPFVTVDASRYFGIMYPQLGMMMEAFSDSPCLLISRPLICHRTQTLEEKRKALGHKETEKQFMSDYQMRDAIYFSFRLIRFLNHLIECRAVSHDELDRMHEFVFANIALKSFIIRNIELAVRLGVGREDRDWDSAFSFFHHLNLDPSDVLTLKKSHDMDVGLREKEGVHENG
ncbi:hypothetical protein JCM14469_05160 [Desulfatiferula olefinivorans]